MGTYTTNKNLFMPTVGEQGWGTLVNGNFETIDSFLKPITVSGSTYTFTGNQTGGSVSATSITNSGTLTSTGKITANGGIGTTTLTASSTSTFTGKITANGGIGTKALTTTSISNSGKLTQTGTSTFTGKITANGGVNDYEERITALEAGEFETINAGTINATNIHGTVYHEFVKTQPYPWANKVTMASISYSAYTERGWETTTHTLNGTIDLTQFFGITAIDNSLLVNYKLSTTNSPNCSFSNVTITVTDLVDSSNVYTYTFNPGSGGAGDIIQIPVLCSISCTYSVAGAHWNYTISIAPTENIYLK